jgi:hypothetical protein
MRVSVAKGGREVFCVAKTECPPRDVRYATDKQSVYDRHRVFDPNGVYHDVQFVGIIYANCF